MAVKWNIQRCNKLLISFSENKKGIIGYSLRYVAKLTLCLSAKYSNSILPSLRKKKMHLSSDFAYVKPLVWPLNTPDIVFQGAVQQYDDIRPGGLHLSLSLWIFKHLHYGFSLRLELLQLGHHCGSFLP